jgi:tetratricopeptide (TPR) repeat protein
MIVDDQKAIEALVSDLHWQIDQLPRRRVKDAAGNPYNPSYYKRGMKNAIDKGGSAVADYIRHYVYSPPSDGYRKLEEADSLDLACEALVADAQKPYARLFTDTDRELARVRLEPHKQAIERRRTRSRDRVEARKAELPDDVEALRALAGETTVSEDSIAINEAIVSRDRSDTAAINRLGRAYEDIGAIAEAEHRFSSVLEIDPNNRVARRRLDDLRARRRARQGP